MINFLKLVAAGLAVLILQMTVSQLLTIGGARPDILLIFLLAATLRYGRRTGLWAGFFLGLAQDALSLGTLGVFALLKSNICFWIAVWLEGRIGTMSAGWWMIFVSSAALLQNIIAGLFYVSGMEYLNYLLWIAVPSALYTSLIAFIWILAPFKRSFVRAVKPTIQRSSRMMRLPH
ncbi:MAG: rod shape-determining protein MreD [Calditrichaeota bacterium]|nr:rod shape-determining protein MreD [Calditrichota bacterium]